jgi:hypothetical protein
MRCFVVRVLLCAVVAVAVGGVFGPAGAAAADSGGAVWRVLSVSNPTNFKPGDESGDDAIVLTVVNVGGGPSGCTAEQIAAEPRPKFSPVRECPAGSPVVSPVTISDQLPAGLTAVDVYGDNAYKNPLGEVAGSNAVAEILGENLGPPYGLACAISGEGMPSCTTGEPVDAGDTLVITIQVHVASEVKEGAEIVNHASVSGGGAPSAYVSNPIAISNTPATYGIAKGGLMSAMSSSQAGGHPNFSAEFFLNTVSQPEGADHDWVENPDYPREVNFVLPAGLVGSAVGLQRCSMAEVVAEAHCPRDTLVGTATVMVGEAGGEPRYVITLPVYNIAPYPGEPAAFAFDGLFFPVRLDTRVQPDGEYRVAVNTPHITGGASAYMTSITIWGDPAEHEGPGADAVSRRLAGNKFLENETAPELDLGGPGREQQQGEGPLLETETEQPVPLLTNATECSTPLTSSLETISWEGSTEPSAEDVQADGATGCGRLSFEPGFSFLPETLQAGAPAGYTLNLSVPQTDQPEQLGTPDVKDVLTTLPAGVVLSPSAANDLSACTSEAFDFAKQAPGGCPRNSQIGVVHVQSPAIEETLEGKVYLAAPECGPCSGQDAAKGRMVRLFVQIEGAESEGVYPVIVKLEGRGEINQQTGQLTTTFTNLPQLPFSDFKLVLNGGERAALANPRGCGVVSSAMDVTPWSTPYTPDAELSSPFEVTAGPGGSESECGRPPGFAPAFTANSVSNIAGGFTPFTLSFGRGDADQYLSGLQLQMPPGLLAMISNVSECPEPQAGQGGCPSTSRIGEASAYVGPGSDPYMVGGGSVYLTGPYKGAPYGISVALPAKAGPYTLAGTTGTGLVVVRATIAIDPQTAAVTVTSDPFPTELDGIPLQLREVTATIGASKNFTFNPTDCEKAEIKATLTSAAGATASGSSPLELTNCAALKFKPSLTVSVAGRASKADGASLEFKITEPKGAMGSEAWLKAAKLEVPKQLPARLTTLQQACLVGTFEKNPAACGPHSIVGSAQVHTPLLRAPLQGPIFLVSHGGEKLPDVVIVLQGEGVTTELTGETHINHKTGVTSETFPGIPDVPFESFEASLPAGAYSQFGVNLPDSSYSFCGRRLKMPTHFESADEQALNVSEALKVTGCPAGKKKKRDLGTSDYTHIASHRGRGKS